MYNPTIKRNSKLLLQKMRNKKEELTKQRSLGQQNYIDNKSLKAHEINIQIALLFQVLIG